MAILLARVAVDPGDTLQVLRSTPETALEMTREDEPATIDLTRDQMQGMTLLREEVS